MKIKKAFTLMEIIIVLFLVSIILSVLYKVFVGTFGQMFKTSNKMTNLRAASLILERLKSDLRCAVVPTVDEKPKFPDENGGEFSFVTTSDNGDRKRVIYTFSGNDLKRSFENESVKNINRAKVYDFKVEHPVSEEEGKYIKVIISVDDEKDNISRSANSKGNKVELSAILYPRFFEESMNEEEYYWFETVKRRSE